MLCASCAAGAGCVLVLVLVVCLRGVITLLPSYTLLPSLHSATFSHTAVLTLLLSALPLLMILFITAALKVAFTLLKKSSPMTNFRMVAVVNQADCLFGS